MTEIIQGIKAVSIVKAFLIFPMAAFHLAVMPWSVRPDEFVTDVQLNSSGFKKSQQAFL